MRKEKCAGNYAVKDAPPVILISGLERLKFVPRVLELLKDFSFSKRNGGSFEDDFNG